MLIQKHSSVTTLINELQSSTPIFSNELSGGKEVSEKLLSSSFLLAKQISEFCSDLINKSDTINVFIAGADYSESINHGRSYKLLNTLLGTDIKWNIYLIGDEVNLFPKLDIPLSRQFNDPKVTVFSGEMMLNEGIKTFGLPDILALNHPGFEKHFHTWFVEDESIKYCLQKGVPVIGCSYGDDEVTTDKFYAETWGMEIPNHTANPFQFIPDTSKKPIFEVSQEVIDLVEQGYCNWAGTIWEMKPGTFKVNKERVDIIKDIDVALESIGKYLYYSGQISNPIAAFEKLMRTENGDRIIRIYSQYSLNIDKLYIFDEESKNIMEDNIEIDTSDFDLSCLENSFNQTMLVCSVFRDYIKPEIETEDDDDEFDDEDLPDGYDVNELISMLAGGIGANADFESMLPQLHSLFGFSEKREVNPSEEKIITLINDERFNELSALPLSELAAFRDQNHSNLFHVACTLDNLELLKIAIDSRISPLERDGDCFSGMDICAERGSNKVLEYILDNHIADSLINAQCNRGFTPAHRAITYNQTDSLNILKSHGADMTIRNAVGISPNDYLGE